jgi:hypothetical protein
MFKTLNPSVERRRRYKYKLTDDQIMKVLIKEFPNCKQIVAGIRKDQAEGIVLLNSETKDARNRRAKRTTRHIERKREGAENRERLRSLRKQARNYIRSKVVKKPTRRRSRFSDIKFEVYDKDLKEEIQSKMGMTETVKETMPEEEEEEIGPDPEVSLVEEEIETEIEPPIPVMVLEEEVETVSTPNDEPKASISTETRITTTPTSAAQIPQALLDFLTKKQSTPTVINNFFLTDANMLNKMSSMFK